LDNLHQRISALSPRFLGYPVNQRFDYTELFRFLYFSLNNVGDPFRTSNFRLNSHDIERDVIQIFKYLAGGSGQDIWGYITSGGTEGNIYGLYLARELLPHGIVYFSEDTHYSVAKALRMLQIRGIKIRSQGNGEMDYDDFRRVLNLHRDAPAIVLANIGTTMKGAIDSLPTIQGILEDVGISKHYIHCDAALSGMILPFVDSGQPFGFDHGVDSLAISGHKMIGSPVPCGVVLAKRANVDRAMTNEWVQYVDIFDTTLMGSRSGFAPLLLWHALTSVEAGEYTLKTQVHHSLTMAEYTVRSLRLAGIPAWRHKNSLTVVFPCPTQAILRKWQLATYQDVAHLVTMPNVTRELIDAFVRDMSLGNIEAEPGNA
jgi:histidine decarboxylase